MTRAAIADVLRELRHELPGGIVHAYEDSLLDEFEAWDQLERLLGVAELVRILEGRRVDLGEVDRAVLTYRRRRDGREEWPTSFEVPEGMAA